MTSDQACARTQLKWQIVQVTLLYTAPTAIRALQSFGDKFVTQHSRKTLRILGTVGEPINPEAWKWYHEVRGSSPLLPFSKFTCAGLRHSKPGNSQCACPAHCRLRRSICLRLVRYYSAFAVKREPCAPLCRTASAAIGYGQQPSALRRR